MKIQAFTKIYHTAVKRKGGEKKLQSILPPVPKQHRIATQPDAVFLAMMTKCINQAGFNWRVIEKNGLNLKRPFSILI